MTPEAAHQLIRSRRSIFPRMYTSQPIEREIIEAILEDANWAPTHKLTQPWRYKVLTGKAKNRLGDFLAETYKNTTPPEKFLPKKYEKTRDKCYRAACVMLICMQRDPARRVPEWEEVAALACSVQNMWLSCTAYGIGAYWSSSALRQYVGEFIDLEEGESCMGFFYMGYHEQAGKTHRSPISEKVVWLEA